MHKKSYFSAGDSNTICDRSGFKCKVSECVWTWDGLFVRADFDEQRNEQDFPVVPRQEKVFSNVRGTDDEPITPYTPPTKAELSQ